jgi:hypothetical protein
VPVQIESWRDKVLETVEFVTIDLSLEPETQTYIEVSSKTLHVSLNEAAFRTIRTAIEDDLPHSAGSLVRVVRDGHAIVATS